MLNKIVEEFLETIIALVVLGLVAFVGAVAGYRVGRVVTQYEDPGKIVIPVSGVYKLSFGTVCTYKGKVVGVK